MQEPEVAGCSRPPCQLNEVAVNDIHTPSMASCNVAYISPQAHTMQHGQAISPTHLTDPNLHDTNHTDGSLIGPSFNLTHTNGPRPSTHTNTSRHPTYLNHTSHEQPSPSSPSLRVGDGEPRKALERIVPRTNPRRDNELCTYTGSSADSHELEPSNSNSEPASEARPTSPLHHPPQPPIPCPSQQVQPSLSHPNKADTSFTGQVVEHSSELLQCRLPGHTARNHFSFPGSRRNKHRHVGR